MFELGTRFVAAVGVLLVSWILRVPNMDFAWRWSLAVAGYAIFAAILERRSQKTGQLAELLAIVDAAAIGLVLAASGLSADFAFLIIAPVIYAVSAKGAHAATISPIAVGLAVASQVLLGSGELSPGFLAQCGGILAIGLMIRQPGTVAIEETLSQPETRVLPSVDGDVEFRERFRRLKTYARELELRVGKDKWVSALFEAKRATEGRLTERLSRTLRDQSGAEGVSIHLVRDSRFVFAAASGKLGEAARRAAFDLNPGQSDRQIQERFRTALRALGSNDRATSACILLRSASRLIGMISVHHSREESLDAAVGRINLATPIVATLIEDESERLQVRRRLTEVEVLYEIACLVAGADKPENVLRRCVRDLWPEWEIDHLGAFRIESNQLQALEEQGASLRLLESMSFAAGPGMAGWIGLGMPELFMPDASDDQRVPEKEAIKRRIGSFLAIPIAERFVITASTHHSFGISTAMVETIRLIAAELKSAISRLEGAGVASGLTHPAEFFEAVGSAGPGWLCYLEPLQRSDLLDTFGKPAFDRALRQLSSRLRGVLPPGGLLCRRDEGDFVAFLPDVNEESAHSFLGEASAVAAMVPVRTLDGKQKIPLALRGRIAALERGERAVA